MISKEQLVNALQERHGLRIQEALAEARVAIAGLGGLGSNIAVNLARIGVGHLHLVDFDRVDITNLNRQQYFIHQIGMYKTDAIKENLQKINPYLDVHTDCIKIREENICGLFASDEYICEAFDVPEYKAMLVNSVMENLPGKYIVAASGMAGYADSNKICTKKITDYFYLCGDQSASGGEMPGLMAPRVALCAAHQANMVVGLILGEGK